jgi:subtilisin family serine protease
MFANVVVLLVTATVASGGSAGIHEGIDGANWPEAPQNASENRYVPNEVIVKYSKAAADKLDAQLQQGKKAAEMRLSNSLDELGRKYKVKKVKSIFPGFEENQRRLEAIKNKDKAHLTRKEKHLLRRLARAPKGAKAPDLGRIYKIELEPGKSLPEVLEAYRKNPDVEYAELNHVLSLSKIPNDPEYPDWGQWNLQNIQAEGAWDIHTGTREVVVAVMDTGVDYLHGDMCNNMWVNEAERYGTAGFDDDGNGYLDDVYGYDFGFGDSDPMDDDPWDVTGHGTACAGIIGAEGNNGLNIAGVCWDVRIMAAKFSGPPDGEGYEADGATAAYYATANGADVVSLSWGEDHPLPTMKQALDYAYSQGVVVVAAAGNDNISSPHYPAAYPGVISVAATDFLDYKASYSNYGSWVDIAAPGDYVRSLAAGGGTRSGLRGTSFAGPHVAGACALMLSACPTLTPDEIRDILMETVDPVQPPGTYEFGRLNLFEAMRALPLSRGIVTFDRDYYSCSDEIGMSLVDFDLGGNGSHPVTVTTNGGDSETVTLLESGAVPGVFEGSVETTSGDANIEDGTLQVSHDAIITATYEDSNDGAGNPAAATDTATADCQGPVIFNVQVDAVGPRPLVTFETNEPATARVSCGLACGGPYTIEVNTLDLATQQAVELFGVAPQTDYFFVIEAADALGNTSVDDNAGDCYAFTTDEGPRDVSVPGDYSTIQEAIDASWDGGTVWIADGTYTGEGNRDLDFGGRAITVRSENGPNDCTIDCNGTEQQPHRGFHFHNGEDACSVLVGFTITSGYSREGGAILCESSGPTIRNCVVAYNLARDGGGLFNDAGNPVLVDCTFSANTGEGEGGGMNDNNGSASLTNCTFSMNSADDNGGGIFVQNGSSTNLTGCAFIGNNGGRRGGGMLSDGSSPTLINCTFANNSSGEDGGGVRNDQSSPTFINCTFSENSTAVDGGGMFNIESTAILTDCNFVANIAGEEGGGMWNEMSSLDINDCNFAENSADPCGGAVWNRDCNLVLNNCKFIGNSAPVGAGFYNLRSNAEIGHCVIAAGAGDGICCHIGHLEVTNCRIADNQGAGIDSSGERENSSAVITNCAIIGNGGGVILRDQGNLSITNCLIAGNGADGVYSYNNLSTLITNCTIVSNRGSGLNLESGRALVANCIIRDNFPEEIFLLYSLLRVGCSNVRAGWPGTGNLDADPCFAQAGYWDPNGTPADANDDFWIGGDYHLRSQAGRWDPFAESWLLDDMTSVCIDKGDPASDVGPEPHPNGGRINIGAYGGTEQASKSLLTCWDAAACAGQPYGDADCDGNVGSVDLGLARAAFFSCKGDVNYNCCADFNHDEKVNFIDLGILKANYFGTGYSPAAGNQNCPP